MNSYDTPQVSNKILMYTLNNRKFSAFLIEQPVLKGQVFRRSGNIIPHGSVIRFIMSVIFNIMLVSSFDKQLIRSSPVIQNDFQRPKCLLCIALSITCKHIEGVFTAFPRKLYLFQISNPLQNTIHFWQAINNLGSLFII